MAKSRLRIVVKTFKSKVEAEAACGRLGKVVLGQGEDGLTVWTVVTTEYR